MNMVIIILLKEKRMIGVGGNGRWPSPKKVLVSWKLASWSQGRTDPGQSTWWIRTSCINAKFWLLLEAGFANSAQYFPKTDDRAPGSLSYTTFLSVDKFPSSPKEIPLYMLRGMLFKYLGSTSSAGPNLLFHWISSKKRRKNRKIKKTNVLWQLKD